MINQNAVEWLINELKLNDTIEKENLIIARQIIEQAKAMEREQIEDAWDKSSQTWHIETKNGDQYYDETYGGDK